MSKPTVRTRFAPSPTGYLHIGNARTALFAWLWARHSGGEFRLRIEDTDQARKVDDAEAQIKTALEWLGIDWDGEVVRQSERLAVYRKHAEQLIANGRAERVTEDRGEVVRWRWPSDPDEITVSYFESDRRREQRRFSRAETPSAFEDFVLIKSDGYPTYNFAHVIDDHEAGITNVVRGDEFIPSLNKYVALYQAFDWSPPRYLHLPQILGPDKTPLSKRHGAQDVLTYRSAGYLAPALVNFIALIGWNPGDEREVFTTAEDLIEAFSLEGLQQSPGVFDEAKLRWMNKEHLKARDSGELLALAQAEGFWPEDNNDAAVFRLALQRATTLADLKLDDFYSQRPKLTSAQLIGEEHPETVAVWLEKTQRYLADVTDWRQERIEGALVDIRNELSLTPKQLYPVLREALTGAPQTPALWEIGAVLGKAETMARLEAAAALVS